MIPRFLLQKVKIEHVFFAFRGRKGHKKEKKT